ncbi:MFS general substrate transporter [Ascodesmis nigricans]|uniref:MFS general substrate transporter n=1 Tax=Ascodesmis nigricans TaxID=341454 RepID=A0A4S2MM32_9PEZI|nr:MFS general substrate transporter [Ascodesmis nigricans]
MGRHTLGVLDAETDEVPGTVLLLGGSSQEPLGLDQLQRKQTADGIILDPQPDDDPNDPLNWAVWRRNAALLCLGWHCLVGGGQTPILAAGFPDVAETYGVSVPTVALSTGLYMLGMGLGCVLASPTAIIWGKRPVYLGGVVLFLVASIWSAASPNYASLVVARIVMGMGVAPCEALPSATIAEIFFLHERAYRVGIYTLLLLGGKNLVPLVSAVIIEALGWRWVFWIVAILVGFDLGLLYLFVPETFWDRTPRAKDKSRPSFIRRVSSSFISHGSKSKRSKAQTRPSTAAPTGGAGEGAQTPGAEGDIATPVTEKKHGDGQSIHAHFAEDKNKKPLDDDDEVPTARQVYQMDNEKTSRESLDRYVRNAAIQPVERIPTAQDAIDGHGAEGQRPNALPFKAGLKLWNGRLQKDNWFKAAFRPFVLFAYPAILWSAVVYSLSVGWLIVLSESVAHIYQEHPYNFSALGTGLIYLSPFIGGILGTAMAGKVSDILVRYMVRRNAGIYEPEFRLIMGIPVAITTALGLMGYGWSAENHDTWIVPTVFFGIISFGCSLGSTTSITFAVDSYRQYAAEALVTLNFSKNVLHGFIFSLFFNHWLEDDGSKKVFIALGAIQLGCLLFTIPLYMYGKRLRLWTVKKNLMEKYT